MTTVAASRSTRPAARPERAGSASRSLAVCVVTLALAYSVWYAYSVFLVALLHDVGWSRSVLAGAFSVFTLVQGAAHPVLGWVTDRAGPRRVITVGGVVLALALWADSLVSSPWHLYLTFGVLTAVGVATAGWTPVVVLVQRHFDRRIGLALGIAGAGIGLGIFLVVPLCQLLIQAFGWRWAFRVLSGLCLLWIVPGTWLLVREAPRPERSGAGVVTASTAPSPPGDLSLAGAIRAWPFWLMTTATLTGNAASQTLHVHQAAFLVDHGVTPMMAASVVSVVGGASIVGKTGGGWLSDRFPREAIYLVGMASMMVSLGVLVGIAVRPTPWLAYAYAVPFGAGYSVTASLMPAIVSDRFRGRHFGAIFGMMQIGGAVGNATGAWLAGRIFDATGSYMAALGLAAGAVLTAAIAIWASRRPRR